MKRNISLKVALTTATIFMLFNSCTKDVPFQNFFNPLIGGCQVAEYHVAQFDPLFPTPPPYLFRKTFDASGRIVKEIDCNFTNDILPADLLSSTLHLKIGQKGWVVYLIKEESLKADLPDTVVRIYLNEKGRPDSCIGGPGSDPQAGSGSFEKEYYTYKDNRVTNVKSNITFIGGGAHIFFDGTNTVKYDNYGNPLSFGANSYTYDYTRKARQQFYCDDFMGIESDFYLLQYLGFFPEVTSPVNVRTGVNTGSDTGGPLTDQRFDGEGRLIGYAIDYTPVSITWNCK
jgi:hypothetical protein